MRRPIKSAVSPSSRDKPAKIAFLPLRLATAASRAEESGQGSKMKLATCFFAIVAVVFVRSGESTICAPLSFFNVDGTICRCSTTGKEYTCKELIITKPNGNNAFFKDEDDTYVLYTRPQTRSYGLGQKITNDNFPRRVQDEDSESEDDFGESPESNSEEINSFEDFNRIRHPEK